MKRVALLVLIVAAVAAVAKERAVGHRPPSLPTGMIDREIYAKAVANGVALAPVAGDEEFLRRVTLDLTGAIPTAEEVLAFLADGAPDKRAKKIDELLRSDAFADRWTMWFGDHVQNVQIATNSRQYYLGRNVYYQWIRESIASGKPYDQMIRELLAGEGSNFSSGVANYVVRQLQNNGPLQDTYDNLATHSTEKFLGLPVLCISCHDGLGHLELVNTYLRDKKREDFWRMAAFFARTTIRPERYTDPAFPNVIVARYDVLGRPNGSYVLNTNDGNKSPRMPRPGQPVGVTPAFLLTGEEPRPGEPYRVAYGRMLTAERQFARNTVNLLWKEMFGRAIVEPVNGFDLAKLSTQASHPALLEALTSEFIASGYDIRALLRTIALSQTYQLSSKYSGPHPHESYFARREPRRLHAEVLIDAIGTATNVRYQFNVRGIGILTKAMQLPDPLEARGTLAGNVMNTFGRGDRDDVLRTNDSAISQALALMNDRLVTDRVRRTASSTVGLTLAATTDRGQIADRLYLATLSRRPTLQERAIAVEYLNDGPLNERAEDLQYVLLNTLEFSFN